ncbi:MAG: cohesin domain-containing protein [Candidatus Hydrogenedentes bacterium]|nr:cohesin domain-containing protein [Candidatus Hydrogenedentota bacterium]
MVRSLAAFGALMSVALCVHAGTLRVGVPDVQGTNVVLPVLLEGEIPGGVAALDFTLLYDPAVFEPVGAEAGAAAVAARKQVQSNESSPGNYVVTMFGMNQTTVQNGQIVEIILSAKTLPSSNQSAVTIDQTTLASVDGFEIASQGSDQTITFRPAPNDDGDPDNEPKTPEEPGAPEVPNVPAPPPPTPANPATPGEPAPGGVVVPRVPGNPNPVQPRDLNTGSNPFFRGAPDIEAPAPLASTAGRLARMNAAAKQMDSARASLNAPTSSDTTPDAPIISSLDSSSGRAAPSSVITPGAQEIGDATRIALASPNTSTLPGKLAPKITENGSTVSVISDTSRRGLIIVMIAVAMGAILIRIRKRRA